MIATVVGWPASAPLAQAPDPCAPPNGNPIKCENALTGNPRSEWDIVGAGDDTIQGFATDISVNHGQTIQFKVDTNAHAYRLDIYRLGYYGGAGARKVATVSPSASLPQSQPDCVSDPATGLVDCGNWAVSASWSVPSTAVSGVYIAKLVRTDTGGASHIVFVVRNDASHSDILFQTADTTWQAYNAYGGNSLYVGSPDGRAYKVSYNRPLVTREVLDGYGQPNALFWAEYPMLRFLEANGYDVSYFSGVDAARSGSVMTNHKTYVTAGHDEYWSGAQRANVESAVSAGVNLAAFAGNFIYWKVRFEPSIDGASTANRTLVGYKETLNGAKIDPSAEWTGTWRDPSFSPPSNGGRPENALAGTIFTVNRGANDLAGTAIQVPEPLGKARIWRNTSVATLAPGEVATLAQGTLGYEWDEDLDNGFRPAGVIDLSSTTESVPDKLVQGYGSFADFGPGVATHSLTLHRKTSGALVFSAGTVQFAWGLDAIHDGPGSTADVRMQQAVVNLFADMSMQPLTLQTGLTGATKSTDTTPPVALISYPGNGQQLSPGAPVTITGTASDVGGIVAGVEISVNGGTTWHPAAGRTNWTYIWTPTTSGSYTIAVRAVDDSANIQAPAASIVVSSQPDVQPPTVTARTPTAGATGVSAGTIVTATFNEPMSTASISTGSIELRNAANQLVTSTVTYDSSTRTATLRPTATLAFSTTYTARVRGGSSGVKDFSGNPLAADSTWSFTTWSAPPCPCSIWDPATASPATVDSADTSAYELGVKFRSDYDGFITGLRFYKSATNIGVHTGSLWRADGTLLATLTFSNETTSGWQEAYFSSPVAVTAQSVYVASYHVPNGHYSLTANYFQTSAVDNSPLHAPATTETPNGVFSPGATAFPDQSYNASNYWVDAIYLSAGGDTTPPTISVRVPAAGATEVSPGAPISVTFSEAVQAATVSASTFQLKSGSSVVPATVSYNLTTRMATLQPTSTLAFQSPFSVTVKGTSTGIKDLAGNAMVADATWSFATGGAPACPCSLFAPTAVPGTAASTDTGAYELGMRVSADYDGYITGVRLYRGVGNTATSVSLWTATGTLLATAPVPASGVGWQQVSFTSPVAVTARAIYVASYYAPGGRYAFDGSYFNSDVVRAPLSAPVAGGNGVFKAGSSGFPTDTFNASNYWVDVAYVTALGDSVPPTVVSQSPSPNSTGVSAFGNVAATFSEPVSPSTISGATFTLKDASSQSVAATVTYDAATISAILDPAASLTPGTTYTARLIGGAAGIKDTFGNALAADVVWSFTAAAPPSCPCSIWSGSTAPAIADSGDGGAYELGVKFQPSVDGFISSVRFYKSAANVGAHVATLWSAAGVPLASATFQSETASGWQEVSFDNPVAVTAGQVYVASYWSPVGHYSVDAGFFAANGITTGPLHALGDSEGMNGVFHAGSQGFPTDSYNSGNYWVDVVFLSAGGADAVPPTVTSFAPVQGATVPVSASVLAEFSEGLSPATLNGSTFVLTDDAGLVVASSLGYNAAARLATLQPLQALRFGVTYAARLVGGGGGIKDLAGNPLAADAVWTFTTASTPSCPCSFWDPLAVTPTNPDSGDGNPIELGIRFQASVDGEVSGLRFYKSDANVGNHVATLWTSTGALLASAPFAAETPSGWQQVTFTIPVPVLAGTTYVASYFAPSGHYAYQSAYFANPLVTGPLTASATTNGVFRYGATGFPTESFNATNYWVDVVFQPYAEPLAVSAVENTPSGTGASITWSSNVAADSQVDYGTSMSYGQTTTVSALSTAHIVALSGLTTNTVYHFRARSRDAGGRIAVSGDYTFSTDVTPPVVSAVQVTGLTGTAASIAWTTSEVADSQVEYGTTVSYGSTSALNATLSTSHTVALSGLLANTTYHYRIRTRDAAGNLGVSADATFNTDIIPPVVSAVAVTSITSTGGTIGWTTNEPADTQVEYGLTTSYGSTSPLQAALASSHSVVLSSLQTNRTYHFRIRTKDARGNLTVTPDFTFATDGTAPTISAVTAVPGQTSFTITWTTDEPADTQADYGTSSSYGSSSTLQAALVTTHTVTITGLQTNRTYNYRVKSRDAAGNLRTSSNFTVVTDATAPTISSVQANETATSATVTWSTNESSDSQVEYGLTTSYGSSSVLAPALVSSHSVVLSGLQANKAYHFRVKSRDAAGNLATSSDFTLSTDVTAPTISAIASVANQSGAAITWTTNESSDTQVEYGTTTSYGSTSSLQSSLVTSHSAALSGLQGNRTYHFRVRSRDAAGNLAVSGDFTFATDGTAPTISNITETRVSSTSERINWTTNEASDTQIQYGTSQSNLNQSTTLVTTMTTAHNQTLTGLQSNRTYYYRVMSRDAAGNLATSATGSFATN